MRYCLKWVVKLRHVAYVPSVRHACSARAFLHLRADEIRGEPNYASRLSAGANLQRESVPHAMKYGSPDGASTCSPQPCIAVRSFQGQGSPPFHQARSCYTNRSIRIIFYMVALELDKVVEAKFAQCATSSRIFPANPSEVLIIISNKPFVQDEGVLRGLDSRSD